MAVIGHVEWIEFAVVERVPRPGEIVHADQTFQEPAGGGAVAAVQLAKLAGAATLYTALGDDPPGRKTVERLADFDVRVEAVFRPRPQRRGFVYLDANGERTITTIGERMGPSGDDSLPWSELAETDGVYFTAGDEGALRAGRAAAALVATSRILADLAKAGVALDALVGSGRDPAERYVPGALQPPPRLAVATSGSAGGAYLTADGRSGSYRAEPPPGPVVDAYGCGDSFAAGLAFAIGAGYDTADALQLAARCGAACLTGRGPYQGQLRLTEAERPPQRKQGW
jgi:ribokinase